MWTNRWVVAGGVLLGGWVLGLVHGVLSAWVPVILFKLLMLAAVAGVMVKVLGACGEHVYEGVRWRALPLLGAGLGVVTLWGSWCGWVWAASDYEAFLAVHPLTLFDVVRGVTEHVEYTANSHGMEVGISRASVRAAWVLEAAAIAGGGFLAGVFVGFGREEKRWGV